VNRSYFYVFDHSTKEGLYNYQVRQTYLSQSKQGGAPRRRWNHDHLSFFKSKQQRTGAGGGEELNYFFGYPLMMEHGGHGVPFYPAPFPTNYTKAEVAVSELMITHLSNFIHTG